MQTMSVCAMLGNLTHCSRCARALGIMVVDVEADEVVVIWDEALVVRHCTVLPQWQLMLSKR